MKDREVQMDVALDQYLQSNPSVTGSLVADVNGLLVSGNLTSYWLFERVEK